MHYDFKVQVRNQLLGVFQFKVQPVIGDTIYIHRQGSNGAYKVIDRLVPECLDFEEFDYEHIYSPILIVEPF